MENVQEFADPFSVLRWSPASAATSATPRNGHGSAAWRGCCPPSALPTGVVTGGPPCAA
jgi:hypothetical protein